MANELTPCPTTHADIDLKILELLRLFTDKEYRFASRLAALIADDCASLATAAGQADEPICDELPNPQMRVSEKSSLP